MFIKYEEDDLIEKVKSALSKKEDSCLRIFKKLLPKMLVFDPKLRINAKDLLEYLKESDEIKEMFS